MTIKLCLLKSGEDIITDLTEMRTEEGPQGRVIGYFFEKPCVVQMKNPQTQIPDGNTKKAGFEVSLFPWIPLSKDTTIPIPADWLITIVEPVTKLKEMYEEDIVNYGNQSNSSNDNKSVVDKSD